MELTSGFDARMKEINDAYEGQLQRLQEEKDLQSSYKKSLVEKQKELRQAEYRVLLLEKETAEVSCQILAKEDAIQACKENIIKMTTATRDLENEVQELEMKLKENDENYAHELDTIDECEQADEDQVLILHMEITEIQKAVKELEIELQQVKEKPKDLDAKIARQELRNKNLSAMEAKLKLEVGEGNLLKDKLKVELEAAHRKKEENTEMILCAICMRKEEIKEMELELENLEANICDVDRKCAQQEKEIGELETTKSVRGRGTRQRTAR